jgi:hypothetical protein
LFKSCFFIRIFTLLLVLGVMAKPVLAHVAVDPSRIINGGHGLGGVTWFVAHPDVLSAEGCQLQVFH